MDALEIDRADRSGAPEAGRVARPELAVPLVGVGMDDRGRGIGDGSVCGTRAQNDPERLAPTGGAIDLDEGDVVTPGEDADPIGRDEFAAGGAADPADERIEVVARIHRRQV